MRGAIPLLAAAGALLLAAGQKKKKKLKNCSVELQFDLSKIEQYSSSKDEMFITFPKFAFDEVQKGNRDLFGIARSILDQQIDSSCIFNKDSTVVLNQDGKPLSKGSLPEFFYSLGSELTEDLYRLNLITKHEYIKSQGDFIEWWQSNFPGAPFPED